MTFSIKVGRRRVLLCSILLCLTINTPLFAAQKILPALSHYIVAGVYDRWGDTEEAVLEYQKALSLDNASTVIRLGLACSYIKNDNALKAVKELEAAVRLDPEASEPHAILALLYSLQDKPDLAAGEYEKALKNASKADPGNIEICRRLAQIYLLQKKLEAALDTYRFILNLSPNDAEAHFYSGGIYDELKEPAKAEEELTKAIELNPDYAEALNYLGYFYVEQNRNLERAQGLIRRALEIEPANGAYIDSLGWLYFRQGKFPQAAEELERAAGLLPDPLIYDHLGDAYFKLNELQKARSVWQRSLEMDPRQEKIQEKIDSLK